jgi:hypothetical protein
MVRQRLSYANIVGTLALFIALGGTSYAVIKLPRNSVGSREVKNGSLQTVDLASGTLPPQLRGPRGPGGPGGTPGAAGARGPSDIFTAHRTDVGLPTGGGASADIVTLNVPAGSWWVLGSASIVHNAGGTSSDAFRCGMTFNGAPGDVGSVAVIGLGPNAAAAGELVVHEGRALSAPTAIRLRCSHDASIPGTPHAESAQLTAVRTDNLQVQPG